MAERPVTDLEDQLRRYADAVEATHRPAVTGGATSVGIVGGPRPPSGRLMLAAAAVVLAVLGILAVTFPRGDDTIDAGTGDPPKAAPPDGGPTSADLPSEDEAREQCRDEVTGLLRQESPDSGLADDAQVAVQEIPGLNARKVVIVAGDRMFACTVGGGQMLAQMEFNQIDASEIAPGTLSIRGSGGDGPRRTITGRVGDGVVSVSGRLPDGSTFPGIVVGPWFVLDVVVDPNLPPNENPAADEVVTWRLASGEERSARIDFLTPVGGGAPCAAQPECLATRVAEVQAEAARRVAEGQPFTQDPALADGVITEEEFDAAMGTFVDCSVANGLSGYVAPASRFRDWAILTQGGADAGRALGFDSLLWLGPNDPAASSPVPTSSLPPDPYLIEECRTAHVDLVSTLVSIQDEKRRFDENAALTTATSGG